jgi:hypothetical protein
MNPIDFLKIKSFPKSYKNFQFSNNKLNLTSIGDFPEYGAELWINDFIHFFPECYNKKTHEFFLPVKFGNICANLYILNNYNKSKPLYLKSLENFPDFCEKSISISDSIIVKSLKGIGYVKENLILCSEKDYGTKEEVLRDYPDLRIGGSLILKYSAFDLENPSKNKLKGMHIFSNSVIKFNDPEKT